MTTAHRIIANSRLWRASTYMAASPTGWWINYGNQCLSCLSLPFAWLNSTCGRFECWFLGRDLQGNNFQNEQGERCKEQCRSLALLDLITGCLRVWQAFNLNCLEPSLKQQTATSWKSRRDFTHPSKKNKVRPPTFKVQSASLINQKVKLQVGMVYTSHFRWATDCWWYCLSPVGMVKAVIYHSILERWGPSQPWSNICHVFQCQSNP